MTKKAASRPAPPARSKPFWRPWYVLPVVALVIAAAAAVHVFRRPRSNSGELPRTTVTISGHAFDVELAVTADTRTRGLMFRHELGPREGMLFVFPQSSVQRFWMRNTYVPLDIIFIDRDRRIINVATMPPETDDTCRSARPARYVLEVPAGTAKALGFGPEDEVRFKLPAGLRVE